MAWGDDSPAPVTDEANLEREGLWEFPEDEAGEDASEDVLHEAYRHRGVRLEGGLRAGYTSNLAGPDRRRGANDLRLSDPDHNTFALTHGSLGLVRDVDRDRDFDFGYAFELVVGRVVEEAYDDGLLQTKGIAVGRAYVDVRTPFLGGTTVGLGKRYGWFGLESVDLRRNFHHSLSYAALSAPRTVTGLSVGFELFEGLTYTQYLVNGADLAIDENDAKSLGGNLVLDYGRLHAELNWIVGAEGAGNESELRWTLEANATLRLNDTFSLSGLVRYGQEERGGARAFALVQAQVYGTFFNDRIRAGLRMSLLHDEDGLITGREQTLGEVTATLEWRPFELVGVGAELRHDHSSEADAFGATRRGQDTVSAFVRLEF